MSAVDDLESDADGAADQKRQEPDKSLKEGSLWDSYLHDYEKAFNGWNEKIDRIEKLYADEAMLKRDNNESEMKVFWANMEVLNPSVFSRQPVPVVAAKFKSRKPIVQKASEVLERCLASSFEADDIQGTMKLVRNDFTLSARGVPWVRMEVEGDYECVKIEHLSRRDFAHGPARKWKEVPWAARRAFLTKKEMRERFEQFSGSLYLEAQYTTKGTGEKEDEDKSVEKKAVVWEFWHKVLGVVCWHSPGLKQVLDITNEPPLNLKGFFPCPRPAYGTLVPGTLKPIPDMAYYADQLEEINSLTNRISALSEIVKLRGFYSAGNDELKTAIESAIARTDPNAVLIPISNVGHLGGGLAEALVWMPLDQIINALQALVLMRKQLIEDVYQITGLSDIMRGATDPNETLGAQQLKTQYGSIRVREKQEELVRVARDLARITGEIISEQFSIQTIKAMAQYDEAPLQAEIEQQLGQIREQVAKLQTDPQMMQAAQANPQQAQQIMGQVNQAVQKLQSTITLDAIVQLLKDENIRPFVLDIETDSTIMPDENAAKQRATEFLGALGTALAQLIPMVQGQPESAEFAGEVIKFAVSPFRAGRSLDQAIDDFVEKMKQTAAQPRPNPEQEKLQAEMKTKEAEAAAKAQEREQQAKLAEQKHNQEMQKTKAAHDAAMAKIEAEMARDAQRHNLEMERLTIERDAAKESADIQRDQAIEKHSREVELFDRREGERLSERETRSAEPAESPKAERSETSEKMLEMVMQNQAAIAQAVGSLGRSRKIIKDRNGDILGIE